MKNLKNFAAAVIMMALCAVMGVSFVSCSGSDVDMDKREKPVTPEVSTKVDDTFVNHNWNEGENSFVDDATSVTKFTEYGQQKSFEISLPASINWTVKEALRASKTFEAGEITLGEEVEDLVDSKSRRDTTVFCHNRVITEKFAETSIEMNTSWENGYVFIGNEKSQLAYVQLDSVKAFPAQTTVNFVEWVDEAEKLERDSFSMPHKAYYTEYSLRGKKNIVKDFAVKGSFLFKGEADNNEPEQPEQPEEPAKENIVDAEFVTRWYNMDEQRDYMTLICTWNNGETEEMTFWVNEPFGYEFPAEWSTNSTKEGPSKFARLVQDNNPSKTEYKETTETNATNYGKVYRRKVSAKTSFVFTDFEEVLSSFHHESYLVINGKDFPFLSPSESIAQGVHAQNTTSNGNISTEKNTVKAEISFNKQLFHAAGIVNVLREVKNDKPETPEEPNEPSDPTVTPDENTIPSEWGEITGVMGVTRICEMIGNAPKWHTCLTIKTTKGQLRVIDKAWKNVTSAFMSFNEVYDDNRMLSGAYRNGTVYPALVSVDATGWTYVAETKTGIEFSVEMWDHLAVSSGIKNFTKDNTAKPSPYVQHKAELKTVNGKKVLTVTCYNVDDKVTDVFTINCIK